LKAANPETGFAAFFMAGFRLKIALVGFLSEIGSPLIIESNSFPVKRSLTALFLFFAFLSIFSACQDDLVDPYDPTAQAAADEALIKEFVAKDTIMKNPVRTASGIYYSKRVSGSGPQIKAGDKVKVHYIGKFLSGQTFESSYSNGNPLEVYPVGKNKVIKGWDEGLQLMQEGETTRFYIPSGLAYGPSASSKIPANSCLIFDITVLDVNY
jgi:FKBP-type peptidyl-prolyl cis-trans isomerase